jgi:hypothetical protein
MVVLHKGQTQPCRRHFRCVPGFGEPAARIAKALRRQDQNIGQAGRFDLHARLVLQFLKMVKA